MTTNASGFGRPTLGLLGGPLVGVRAVAEAAGVDGREVLALLRSGNGNVLSSMVTRRQDARQVARRGQTRPAERRRVDWSAFIRSTIDLTPDGFSYRGRSPQLHSTRDPSPGLLETVAT